MVDKEELIEDLRSFSDDIGKVPTVREMDNKGPWSSSTYKKYFDTWNLALESAGLGVNQERDVSKERLLGDLELFAENIGETPTSRQMKENGPWSDDTYCQVFGSWNNALEEAGLETHNKWDSSKGQLLKSLVEYAEEIGESPTVLQMDAEGPFSSDIYKRKFGSWNNALQAAGLEVNMDMSLDTSENALISDIYDVADDIGHTPTTREMNEYSKRSSTVYINHFGSWNNALEAAGLEVNRLGPSELAGTGECEFGEGYLQKRAETYERDKYECRVCGDGDLIHCHHIKPRRTFDDVSESNTLDNLITLCPSCHGRFEGRWQNATPDEFAEKAKEHR